MSALVIASGLVEVIVKPPLIAIVFGVPSEFGVTISNKLKDQRILESSVFLRMSGTSSSYLNVFHVVGIVIRRQIQVCSILKNQYQLKITTRKEYFNIANSLSCSVQIIFKNQNLRVCSNSAD